MEHQNKTTEESSAVQLDLRQLLSDGLRTMRRLLVWFLILLILSTAFFCWRVYSSYQPMYRASATFTVYVMNPLQSEIRSYNTATAEQMAKTFPYILTSGALSDRVKEELHLAAMPSVSASVLSNTNILTLTVTSADPQLAYNVLNAVIEYYPDIAEFVVGPTVLNLLDESGQPTTPFNTRDYRAAIKRGVMLSAVLWIAAAFALAAMRTSVHNESELHQILNARTLCVLLAVHGRKKKDRARCPRFDEKDAPTGFAESVRLMRIRTEKALRAQNGKVLLVSSATPGEGKTTVAVNLASSLAETGARVILIDCDLRNPSVARCFGLESENGLVEYLRGDVSYQNIARRSDRKNLYLVFSGKPCGNAAELLSMPECRSFVDACRHVFDYVILDTPPAALLADAAEVAVLADAALLTVRQNYASRRQILAGAQILADSHLPLIGCVINYAESRSASGSYYGYGYGYGYGSSYSRKAEKVLEADE